jgi:hypothetical protein
MKERTEYEQTYLLSVLVKYANMIHQTVLGTHIWKGSVAAEEISSRELDL